jgi:type IX secretion system PorP/SprF family membrane protein
MNTLKKIIVSLVLVAGTLTINAQQDPMFTHYMYNTLLVNPGYAGSRNALTVTALHRSQWLNFKGAPTTQTLTLHAPLSNKHIGLGLSVLNDKIGPVNKTSLFVDFAYIISFKNSSKLALGLSGGVNIFKANLNTLELDQLNDPAFQNSINTITPDFGFGAYYSRERFYVGISAPNLIQSKYSGVNQVDGNTLIGKEQRHYFIISGILFPITQNLAFKPTTLIKVTSSAPVQVDLTTSFIIMNRLLAGVMFRTGDALGALVGLDITEQLHIGYSFDWSYGIKTFEYNQGSHEILLRYDFNFSGKKQIHSPRYF